MYKKVVSVHKSAVMRLLSLLILSMLVACEPPEEECEECKYEEEYAETEVSDTIAFFEFTPDTSDFTENEQILADYAYQLDDLTIVAGYNQFGEDEAFAIGDTEDDWGDRLYVLNSEEEIVYQSQGVGDYYLFEPHFYKNKSNDQVIIVCQLGFEYYDGGEVFLLEKGEVSYLGNIDITGTDQETNLIDVLDIKDTKGELVFSFQADSVILSLGSGDPEIVSASEINYRYENGELSISRDQ